MSGAQSFRPHRRTPNHTNNVLRALSLDSSNSRSAARVVNLSTDWPWTLPQPESASTGQVWTLPQGCGLYRKARLAGYSKFFC